MKLLNYKYVLITFVVAVVLFSCAILVKKKAIDMANSGALKMTEGEEYGINVSDETCVISGVEKYKSNPSPSLGSEVDNSLWLAGCLKASRKSESFCNAVPEIEDLTNSVQWINSECLQFGRSDPYCASLFQSVQRHCHPSKKN